MIKRAPLSLIILFSTIFLSSCSKLANLNELLTLKGVADSQTAMAKDVAATNKLFDQLAAAVKTDKIKDYATQSQVQKQFGPPILERVEQREFGALTVWLYRYATEYFSADKVYLYFDPSGKLKEWKYVEGHQ